MGTSAGSENAGTPPGTGGTTDGGTGTPPGTGTTGTGTGGEGRPAGLDRSKLNPILAGMNEEGINDLMDTMIQAVRNGGTREAAPVARAPEPEVDYRELMDPASDKYNPKAAMQHFVQTNYGGVITDLATRANEGVFQRFRDTYHDFKEYEEDVRKAINQSGNPNPSMEQINGIYLAAKGYRITQKEMQERTVARTRPPSPPVDTTTPKPIDLEPGEETIARRMFRNEADPIAAYRQYVAKMDGGQTTVKVPLSGGIRR